MPKKGEFRKGYYFKGGNPKDKSNWVKPPEVGTEQKGHVYQGGAPWDKDSWKKQPSGFVQGAVNALPAVGSIVGGALGTPLGPAGIAGGGLLGAGLGKGLEGMIESAMYDKEPLRAPTVSGTSQALGDVGKEMAMDVGFAGLGAVARPVARAVRGGADDVLRSVRALGAPAKETAEEITEAGARLGVKPTKGMLSSSEMVGGMESSLMQQPTRAGRQVLGEFSQVDEGLEAAAKKVMEPGRMAPTVVEAGEQSKGLITANIGERLDPAVATYQAIEDAVPFIEVGMRSVKPVARNIRNVKYAKIKGSPEASFANQIADSLEGVQTLEDLRVLKTYVGQVGRDINTKGPLRFTAGEIGRKLAKMEQNAITRSAIAATKDKRSGKAIATEMINQIKDANKIYGEVSQGLKEFARKSGMGKVRDYSDFINKLEGLKSEDVVRKFFNPKNIRAVEDLKSQFPEAFDALRNAKLGEIYSKSVMPKTQELSFKKLIGNVRRLSPEMRQQLFNADDLRKLDDIQTVYASYPERMGPSGTPQGLSFQEMNPLSPKTWINEIFDRMKRDMIKNPDKYSSGIRRRFQQRMATEGLMTRPQMLEMVRTGSAPVDQFTETVLRPIGGEAAAQTIRQRTTEQLMPRGLIQGFQGFLGGE